MPSWEMWIWPKGGRWNLPKGDITPLAYLVKWVKMGKDGSKTHKMGDIIYGWPLMKILNCEIRNPTYLKTQSKKLPLAKHIIFNYCWISTLEKIFLQYYMHHAFHRFSISKSHRHFWFMNCWDMYNVCKWHLLNILIFHIHR